MRKIAISLFLSGCMLSVSLQAQQAVQAGKGSYASYPPEAVAYEDGYFAAPYNWFEQAWPELNLHENARNKPLPTNDWWTDFIFRGLGRIQPEYHVPPVTVTTTGDRFGTEAWAYPHVVKASKQGFDILFPKGFSAGGMNRGNPLKINATTVLQSNDENILFTDFESPSFPEGWVVSNNTQNITGPMATSEITQSPRPTGYTGDRFFNSFKGDAARITLTSPKFTIEKNYIRLYVGGGNHPEETYVGLFVNGSRVRSETGQNSGTITQRTWNVTEYKGQEAEIRIVDESGGGWGFIMCDEIVFTDSEFGGSGYTADFQTTVSKVYDWTDLGFTLRSENNGKYMDATIIHGVPFTYVELKDLYPILTPDGAASAYDINGIKIEEFPVSASAFTIEFDGRIYGVHMPNGSKIHQSKGGDFQIEVPDNKRYVVISVLPERSLLATYHQYAANKPENTVYNYEYKVSEGKIVTTFDMSAKNLDTGASGQDILMCFLPHHYRTTTQNFNFVSGAEYPMFIGKMKTGAGKSFSLAYNFGGMPPYLPAPLDMTPERTDMLNSLLDYSSTHFGRNGNTYAKGLGEQSTMMLMAKELNHSGFDLFRNALKAEFADWYTFEESEKDKKSYYFAEYPKYGAVIGFPPGYGSQGFNDLHFHNGYFTVGSARMMMADKEFKRDYAEMAKLVTRTYANWDRYENEGDIYIPFLRTFDPYLGHSFAGGTGDGGGNNQESTSEAINSWFGVYMMGVELNDPKITATGAMGYMLEVLTAGEYWLDLYEDNFSDTYEYEYVGILRTDNLARATYFSGDPAWALGIQACPVDFFFTDFGLKPERMAFINDAMFKERTAANADNYPGNADPYENIKLMGPYLGGYHLNILNYIDPEKAAQWLDEFCKDPVKGQEWRNHFNTTTNYYMSNAMITYGKPAEGYHTSIPSGAVYINKKGELTYLLYNPTSVDVDVDIYKDGNVLETVKVAAGKYYNSRVIGGQKPNAAITTYKDGDKMALNKEVKIAASASDKDGSVLWVDFYFDGELIGTSYAEPYEVKFAPSVAGIKELKAIATDNEGNKSEPNILNMEVLTVEQTPYPGTPWNIPQDKILVVQFDNGGPEISCHDNEIEMQGGNNFRPGTGVETENSNNGDGNIGYTNTGEWLEYTVNVQETGVYAMSARLASAGGGALRIYLNGEDKTGSLPIISTGSWGNYRDTIIAKIPMQAGKQIMRVLIDQRGVNLSSYKFTLLSGENIPSEVEAGDDKVILLPENSTTLNAVAKTYGEATITKYEWSQIDVNAPVTIAAPDQATTAVSGLETGTYVFEVKITDSNGLIATDKVAVAVKPGNFAPIANPGNTRTIGVHDELILDGRASHDPDGEIIRYEWTQVDSNPPVTIRYSNTDGVASVTGLEANKLYIFRLTVTDDQNATGYDNVRIFVTGSTGLDEMFAPQVTVYPNPFTDQLIIHADNAAKYEKARLYSIEGNMLLEEDMKDRPVVYLNTSDLNRGYYILVVFSDKGTISRKVIK